MEGGIEARRSALLCWAVYAVVAVAILTEKFGRTTSDTRLDLTEAPVRFLVDTFSMWNPRVSLGEMQNQAYGYLFPMGPFFALGELAQVPGWVVERSWSVLLVVVAAEGLRRCCRAIGVRPYAAALAGLCYALTPRHVAELGVRSAEILPGAVLPWALLPILLVVQGRRGPVAGALLSAAAYAFAGGVNGTVTVAPVGLLLVVVGWAWATRRVGARFVLAWGGLMALVNAWWVLSLLRFGAYSPPFFDYVEDAPTTTTAAGWSAALRGASNWVNYINVNGALWWPAGYDVSLGTWAVFGSGVIAVLGLVGLARHQGTFRVPLLLGAALGLVSITIAHVAPLDSPLSPWLQDLLDGPLAPLRNVPKADPILRVPLAIGAGLVLHEFLGALTGWQRGAAVPLRRRVRTTSAFLLALVLPAALVATALPVLQGQLRTPGWDEIPSYWVDAAAHLDRAVESQVDGTGEATWVVPGSGFGIQEWGWTMEEPMQVLGSAPWVTRSQIPLTPSATIRMLSTLEEYIGAGAGSPYLAEMLRRIGVGRVLVRHDLDPVVSLSTPSTLAAIALSRSPGIERDATFGSLRFGPAIEVFEVTAGDEDDTAGSDGVRVRDVDDVVTVSSSVEDVLRGVGAGLISADVAAVVRGESGWDREAVLVGDGLRNRERAFGRVHQAESAVLAQDEPFRGGRVVPNYPGPPGARKVVAEYVGVEGVTASSSAGYADALGPIRPETAPWSVVDGQDGTYWTPAPFQGPAGEWWRLDLGEERTLGRVVLQEATAHLGRLPVTTWRVRAGGTVVRVDPDPVTGRAEVDLEGTRASSLVVEVAEVPLEDGIVALAEVEVEGVEPQRTLRVPEVPTAVGPSLLFTARPEARACVATLLGPTCDSLRHRPSDEAGGIDRTFRIDRTDTFEMRALVVARARPGTLELLRPVAGTELRGSSVFENDPTVAPRLAHDGDPTTSWVADPRDRDPVVRIDLGRRRTVSRLEVDPPTGLGVRPVRAVVEARGETRTVDLRERGRFEPLRARNLTVTFSRPDDDSQPALGMSELRLGPIDISQPLDPRGETGAVCGFGPPLVVDGVEHATRVEGALGQVVAGGQLAVRTCDGPVRLGEGEHRVALRSTEQFQPVAVVLDSTLTGGGEQTASRSVRLESRQDTEVVLEVSDGEAALLTLPQSFNPGWEARAGGRLLEPIQVDGWAQGWVVPEDVSGQVVARFVPQRGYLVTLVVGLVLMGLVLLAAAVVLVVRRAGPRPEPPPPVSPGRRAAAPVVRGGWRSARVARAATGGLVGGTGLLLGGPVVAAGALLGWLLRGRARLAQTLGVALVLGALAVHGLALLERPQFPSDVVDLVTAAGVALVLGAAAGRAHRRPPGQGPVVPRGAQSNAP